MNTELLAALRNAEAAAWAAMGGDPDKVSTAHGLIAAALRMAEATQRGDNCAAPTCANTVEYSGTGRPALYCSRRCRDRAAYVARRQQRDSAER